MQWLGLCFWIVVCFAVAALGGHWTSREIPTWYATLHRPSIAPPNWVFGPVWTTLYAMMATAAWLISRAPASPQRNLALALFVLQLGLNLTWSWIFFRQHALGAAFGEIVALWLAIGATVCVALPASRAAALLLLPYWAWVSFASVLNAAYWRLNPA